VVHQDHEHEKNCVAVLRICESEWFEDPAGLLFLDLLLKVSDSSDPSLEVWRRTFERIVSEIKQLISNEW
jgi:hypothetical protein